MSQQDQDPGTTSRGPRCVVRALVLDEQDQVLLLGSPWDGASLANAFWTNPGFVVRDGETRLEALQRGLRLLAGLVVDALGPEVWSETLPLRTADSDAQIERTHLYRVVRADLANAPDDRPANLRWWAPEDLQAPGTAVFLPPALPELVRNVLRCGP